MKKKLPLLGKAMVEKVFQVKEIASLSFLNTRKFGLLQEQVLVE